MVHPYLRRRNKRGGRELSEQDVEAVLKTHLGCADFPGAGHETAIVAAAFRRARLIAYGARMAAWKRKGRLGAFQKQLIDGMLERGYAESFAPTDIHQILGSANYDFRKLTVRASHCFVYTSVG